MSKMAKRRKAVHSHSDSDRDLSTFLSDDRKRWFLGIALVLILAGIPFALGKYFEFKSPGAFDSGSYVYSARHVLSGARIGYEEKPSAQAGTLLFNMLGVKLFGFREVGAEVLQMLLQAAALVLMFITTRRIYGVAAAVISTTITSVYLSAPLLAKYGNVKEQFMIAFMILGICCFIFSQIKGKWWLALLAGALLVWGPMFKQTGLSAIAAVGGFVLLQPIFHRTQWKQAGKELLFLTVGGFAVLVPIGLWYASMDTPLHYWPYSFIIEPVVSAVGGSETPRVESETASVEEKPAPAQEKPERSFILKLLPGYVSDSWAALQGAQRKQAYQRVWNYYRLLILPILMALAAIVARIVVVVRRRGAKKKEELEEDPGRFALLLAIWWFFDMAFVWISPRSYEQYYLPLNASAAMLGGYIVYLFAGRLQVDRDKTRWIILGLLSIILMMGLSWHIFFGIAKSPHTGVVYTNYETKQPERARGYTQKWAEVAKGGIAPWERIGEYIEQHSDPNDRIYVWGWVPGIYVKAQRLSSAPKPFEGTMHTLPPAELARRVAEILGGFEKYPPKFIVDTRKRHFPWDRPALELWPHHPQTQRAVPLNQMQGFEQEWGKLLGQEIEPAEEERFKAMEPFRRYVMNNYKIIRELGPFVLFERK